MSHHHHHHHHRGLPTHQHGGPPKAHGVLTEPMSDTDDSASELRDIPRRRRGPPNGPGVDHADEFGDAFGENGPLPGRRSAQNGARGARGAGPRSMRDSDEDPNPDPYGSRVGGGGMAGRSSHGRSRAGFEDMQDAMDDMDLNPHGHRAGGGGISTHGSQGGGAKGPRSMRDPIDDSDPNPRGSRAGSGNMTGRTSHGESRAGHEDIQDAMGDMKSKSHGRHTGGGGMSNYAPDSGNIRGWRDMIALFDEWDCNPRKPRQRKRDVATLRNDQRTMYAAMRALPAGYRGTVDEEEEVMIRKRTLEEDLGAAERKAEGRPPGMDIMRKKYGEGFDALEGMSHGKEPDKATLKKARDQTMQYLSQGRGKFSDEEHEHECIRQMILQHDLDMLKLRKNYQDMATENGYMSSTSRQSRAGGKRAQVPQGWQHQHAVAAPKATTMKHPIISPADLVMAIIKAVLEANALRSLMEWEHQHAVAVLKTTTMESPTITPADLVMAIASLEFPIQTNGRTGMHEHAGYLQWQGLHGGTEEQIG